VEREAQAATGTDHSADDIEAVFIGANAFWSKPVPRHPVIDVVAGVALLTERRLNVSEIKSELCEIFAQRVDGAADIFLRGSVEHCVPPRIVCRLTISSPLSQIEHRNEGSQFRLHSARPTGDGDRILGRAWRRSQGDRWRPESRAYACVPPRHSALPR